MLGSGSVTCDDQPEACTDSSSQCVACNKVGQVDDNHHKVIVGKNIIHFYQESMLK